MNAIQANIRLDFSPYDCNEKSIQDAAIDYHRCGLLTLATKDGTRIDDKGKLPIFKSWPTRPFLIDDYRYATGCGIQGGGIHKIVIVDIDGDLTVALQELEESGLVLPETLTASTPRGGRHYFYRYEDKTPKNGVKIWKSSASNGKDRKGKPIPIAAIDIRSENGFVVAPPSHERRVWLTESTEIALIPEWILCKAIEIEPVIEQRTIEQRIQEKQRSDKHREHDVVERASKYLEKMEIAIQGQNGSGATIHAMSRIALGFNLTDNQALQAASEWNKRCEPPWSNNDLLRKIREGRKLGQTKPGELLEKHNDTYEINSCRNLGPKTTQAQTEEEPQDVTTLVKAIINNPDQIDQTELSPSESFGEFPQRSVIERNDQDLRDNQNQSIKNPPPGFWCIPSARGVSALDTRANIIKELWNPRKNLLFNAIEIQPRDLRHLIHSRSEKEFPFRPIKAEDKVYLKSFLEANSMDRIGLYDITPSIRRAQITIDNITEALGLAASRNEFNPVTEYLEKLPPWDGIDRWTELAKAMGDKSYVRSGIFFRKWAIGAVKRAFEPGCIMDIALWIHGPEKTGKSSLIRSLAPNPSWVHEVPNAAYLQDRFSMLFFNSAWLVELAEAEQYRTPQNEKALKAWMTIPEDRGMKKGQNDMVYLPRRFAVVATTNEDSFATNSIERRWLPVFATQFFPRQLIEEFRDLLWTQALERYRQGEDFRFSELENLDHRAAIAEQRIQDPWEDELRHNIPLTQEDGNTGTANQTTMIGDNKVNENFYSYRDLYFFLSISMEKRNQSTDNRIKAIMKNMGFFPSRVNSSRGFHHITYLALASKT
jgi:hypothetical protein